MAVCPVCGNERTQKRCPVCRTREPVIEWHGATYYFPADGGNQETR